MTIKEIIDGLKFTVEMFMFDPTTGETYKEPRNDMDKTTIDACNGAIELLEQSKWIPVSERTPEHGGEYLLWGKICDDGDEEYCFLGDYYEFEEKFGIEKSNYDPHTLGFLDTEIDEYYSVVAWMPLPEPYKTESEKEGSDD